MLNDDNDDLMIYHLLNAQHSMNENILYYSLNLQNTPFMYVFLLPLFSRSGNQGLDIKQLSNTQRRGRATDMNLHLPTRFCSFNHLIILLLHYDNEDGDDNFYGRQF